MTIDNNKLSNLLKELYRFSPMTYEHSLNVSNLAVSFAQEIGLIDSDIEKLRIAGLLHDIGKLKIPENILNKPSKFTVEEYEIMKMHSRYGVDLLTENGFSNDEILNLILCHHERIDGQGYPNGLKDESIPQLAKIITICDSFDAMSSLRNYSDKHDMEYIIKEFLDNAGTQFDSYYANLFIQYLNEKNIKIKK